jgi:hypothetical protein
MPLLWKSWNWFERAVGGISGNCSTCFWWYHHPSSEAQTTVSTTSGFCHTITATCRYRGRVGTGLSVLWVAYLETALHVSGGTTTYHQHQVAVTV